MLFFRLVDKLVSEGITRDLNLFSFPYFYILEPDQGIAMFAL